eukprot:3355418-Rhodomonas_salina.1
MWSCLKAAVWGGVLAVRGRRACGRATFEPKKGKYELVEMDASNQPAQAAPEAPAAKKQAKGSLLAVVLAAVVGERGGVAAVG